MNYPVVITVDVLHRTGSAPLGRDPGWASGRASIRTSSDYVVSNWFGKQATQEELDCGEVSPRSWRGTPATTRGFESGPRE